MRLMMTRKGVGVFASLLLAGVVALAAACGDGDEEDTGDTVPTVAPGANGAATGPDPTPQETGGAAERDAFIFTVQSWLEQIDLRLDELQAELTERADNVREAGEARIEDLRTRVDDMEFQLSEAEAASEEEFETIRQDIEMELDSAITEVLELGEELGL